jgi:hypothetical protein
MGVGEKETAMERLTSTRALLIHQQKEWGEIFTGFEVANRYVLHEENGDPILWAAEVGGNWFIRQFLRQMRPFTIHLVDGNQQQVLEFRRPWRWFFHEVSIYDAEGRLLGTVRRRWSWLRRVFDVQDAAGNVIYELFGPLLHPWTFHIRRDAQELGRITKNWSGMLTEMFTRADKFGIVYPETADAAQRAILLGAVFLIDFAYFEKKQND